MTLKNLFRLGALALLAGLACLTALDAGQGAAHAAVSLLYFQGQHNGNSVLLEWATATELNTAYFYLERANEQGGTYEMLDQIGLVPSEAPPDGLSGAEYQRLDQDNVIAGRAYWYVLVEVESSGGAENRTQPIRVALGDTQATPTATQTATRVPTITPTKSASGTPAATTTPTRSGTLSPSGSTATPVTGRTLAIRTTPTAEVGQSSIPSTSPGQIADNQGAALAQEQVDTTPEGNGYPAPVTESPLPELESDQAAYPAAPPTAQIFATRSYPAPAGPRNLANGTPVPNIGSNNQAANTEQASATQIPENSPGLGTAFLWLGFAAALIVFISAVVGAIYYYSRQRTGQD